MHERAQWGCCPRRGRDGLSEEVAGRQRGRGQRRALHKGPAVGAGQPARGNSVQSRLSRSPSLGSGEQSVGSRLMSGVRDGEGSAKGLVCFFPLGAGEPLKVAEQGRVVNTVLGQQCAGGGGQSPAAGSFWEC